MKQEDMMFVVKAPRTCAAQIAEAEKALGIEFPDDYRRFLLLHNGGRSKLCVCAKPFLRLNEWSSVCAKERLPRISSLVGVHQRLREHLTDDFVSIAGTVGDCDLIMRVRGPDRYRLGVWDIESEEPHKVILPFASFTDLLDHLEHSEEFV